MASRSTASASNASASTASKAFAKKATVIDNDTGSVGAGMFGDFVDGMGLPSTKRLIVAFIAGALCAGGVSYLGAQLVVMLAVGAAMLTGSAFIAYMLLFVGYAITLIVSIMVASRLQSVILDGSLDRYCSNATKKVGGWFSSAATCVTSKFSKASS